MVSVMLYPCIVCVALLMDLFVLCVARLTVFVETIRNMLGVVVILLLNVVEVFSEGGGFQCMVFKRMCVCCIWDPSVHLSVPSIGFIYIYIFQK